MINSFSISFFFSRFPSKTCIIQSQPEISGSMKTAKILGPCQTTPLLPIQDGLTHLRLLNVPWKPGCFTIQ